MNDLEISKALALAIGWKPRKIGQGQINGDSLIGINEKASGGANSTTFFDKRAGGWCVAFDYRDPAVIWPIAAKFDCFPIVTTRGWWSVASSESEAFADTPEKAVAMAVINRGKK
jgi:hypothetical protein